MIENRIGFIAWENVIKSPFGGALCDLCNDQIDCIQIEEISNGKEHANLIKEYKNIVTWATHFIPTDNYLDNNRNVLFIERGLLNRDYIYVDSVGWDSHSSLAMYSNKELLNQQETNYLRSYLDDVGLLIEETKQPQSIVICPEGLLDKDSRLLTVCSKFLPKESKTVVIGPNITASRDIVMSYKNMLESFANIKNWQIEENSLDYYLNSGCCVITNNRFIIAKSLCKGNRAAITSRSLFSGSNAVLDCYKSPNLLSVIKQSTVNKKAIERILYSIAKTEISLNSSKVELLENLHVKKWLEKIKDGK